MNVLSRFSAPLRALDRVLNSRVSVLSLLTVLVVGLITFGASGCVTKTDPAGAVSTDWPATALNAAKVVSPTLQASVKIAARAVVVHNPAHASEFQLSGAAAAALFDVASPTSENFKAAILKAFPSMAPADAGDFADILAGGWASLDQALQQKGITISLTTLIKDPNYKQTADIVLGAIVSGFNDGVATAIKS